MKTRAVIWLIVGLAGLLVYGLFDPQQYFFPKCPFLSLTGWKCPGCGSQRALHQLLQGNVAASFQFNPLFIPALCFAAAGYGASCFMPQRWPSIREKWFGKWAAVVSLVIILSCWVGRNLF